MIENETNELLRLSFCYNYSLTYWKAIYEYVSLLEKFQCALPSLLILKIAHSYHQILYTLICNLCLKLFHFEIVGEIESHARDLD